MKHSNGNWSKVVLEHQIDLNLYERQAIADKKNNFESTLINPWSRLGPLCDMIKYQQLYLVQNCFFVFLVFNNFPK